MSLRNLFPCIILFVLSSKLKCVLWPQKSIVHSCHSEEAYIAKCRLMERLYSRKDFTAMLETRKVQVQRCFELNTNAYTQLFNSLMLSIFYLN